MPTYDVKKTGFLAGRYRKEGEKVTMSEAAAKYFLPPYDNRLAPAGTLVRMTTPAPEYPQA